MSDCFYCHKAKPGVRLGSQFICDDCLNRPERTRPSLYGQGETVGVTLSADAETEVSNKSEQPVVLNKIAIRDDGEDGPLVVPPKDGNLHDVSEAEIAKARVEQANDPRKYAPKDERTMKRIGAMMVEDNGSKESSRAKEKPVTTGVKVAGKTHRRTARPKARKSPGRRAD